MPGPGESLVAASEGKLTSICHIVACCCWSCRRRGNNTLPVAVLAGLRFACLFIARFTAVLRLDADLKLLVTAVCFTFSKSANAVDRGRRGGGQVFFFLLRRGGGL